MRKTSYNFNKGPTSWERIICSVSYFAAIVGLIWIIILSISGKRISYFARFNIYQAVFIAVLYYIARILFSITFSISQVIPLINKLVGIIVFYLGQYSVVFGYSIFDFAIFLLFLYLAVSALIGKEPFIPWISDTVRKLVN